MKPVVSVVVPSYKRSNMVLTHKAVANVIICCPERQAEDYRKSYPDNEVVPHPDDVRGISNARQWIYDHWGDVMMLDDDIKNVTRLMQPAVYETVSADQSELSNLTPQEAYDAIQMTASLAKEMGAYLFGFTSAVKPRDVHPQKPFSLNGYVKGTTMGLLNGSKLHFPKEKPGQTSEDHYITLLNAYYHRYCLIDNRFGFIHIDTFKRTGGCSDYRTVENEEDAYRFLRQKFGDAIQLKGADATGKFKRTHQWERVINLPY